MPSQTIPLFIPSAGSGTYQVCPTFACVGVVIQHYGGNAQIFVPSYYLSGWTPGYYIYTDDGVTIRTYPPNPATLIPAVSPLTPPVLTNGIAPPKPCIIAGTGPPNCPV